MKETDPKVSIDHIDGDGLNCQKSNLRRVTGSQNSMNRRGKQSNNKSCFRGVSWHNRDNCWVAQITKEGKHTFIGNFESKEDAAKAYDSKAKELFGCYSGKLNFPDS